MGLRFSDVWNYSLSKGDYNVFTYHDESSGLRWVLGEGPIDFSIDTALDALTDFEQRGSFDKPFDQGTIVEEVINTSLTSLLLNLTLPRCKIVKL